MIYITGDTHRDFSRIARFCKEKQTTTEDIMVILGDAGINYCGGHDDASLKKYLKKLPITLFCIHGNHEIRPWHIENMITKEYNGGVVYYQPNYPNILYAQDGSVFDLGGNQCLVCGGAYSVDKYYRLASGYRWFSDEQPDEEIKNKVLDVAKHTGRFDAVFTHTCPMKYTPVDVFLSFIDQSKVDKTTEEFLDKLEESITYEKWFCGHWHTDKSIDKMRFVFEDIIFLKEKQP